MNIELLVDYIDFTTTVPNVRLFVVFTCKKKSIATDYTLINSALSCDVFFQHTDCKLLCLSVLMALVSRYMTSSRLKCDALVERLSHSLLHTSDTFKKLIHI